MDPSGHAGHAVADSAASSGVQGVGMMHMAMSFEWGTSVTLWFKSWHMTSTAAYIVSLLGLFALCLAQEALVTYRHALAKAAAGGGTSRRAQEMEVGGAAESLTIPVLGTRAPPPPHPKLLLTLLYAANIASAYLLMLAIMTYNVGYFIVIVAGLAVGHHLFARARQAGGTSDVCCVQPDDDM